MVTEARLREVTGLLVMSDEFCGGGGNRDRRVQAAYTMAGRIAHLLREDDISAPDPRTEVQNVYRYLLSRWSKAQVGGDTQRAIHLFQALDTIRSEWPEVIAADEEE